MAGAWRSDARRWTTHTVAVIAMLALLVGTIVDGATAEAATAETTQASRVDTGIVAAADLSKFSPGNIISNEVFFHSAAMSESQIQSFLQTKVPSCRSGYTCLKDWYDTSRTTSPDAMCGAYSGGVRERASRIIYKVAQACGINPQVILATLQKEQGLVLHTWPSTWRYRIAMGQGCPDTAACDTRYYGFFNQVYGAAWQFKRYANPAGTSNYFTWYAPGKTWNVRWNPNAACGSSPVAIQNQATANLYYYTPYQPNAAALRAGYGTGDSCSSYGNRNFYQYFTDWFGSTQKPVDYCAQPAARDITAGSGEFLTTTAVNARQAPSTSCTPIVSLLAQGTIVTKLGQSGTWFKVRIDGRVVWVAAQYLTPAPPVSYKADRIQGPNRYETAAAIALQTRPQGASTVILASGEKFPDALSGAAHAARQDAAMLLVGSASLPSTTAAAMKTLRPTKVVILGGEAAVSPAVAAAVTSALGSGVAVERLAGKNRYDTSRTIVASGWTSAPTVYLASGRAFPDALSATSVAALGASPVLLADGAATSLPPETMTLLKQLGTTKVVMAGGAAALSEGIASQLRTAGISVDRKGGVDRWETSRLLVASVHTGATPRVFIASGRGFPDALAGSVLAAEQSAPLLISPPGCIPGKTKDFLIDHGTGQMTLLGGTVVLSDAVFRSERC